MFCFQKLQNYLYPDQRNKLATKCRFSNKLNLPSLPVPKLQQTLLKYLKSVEPFLNDQELEKTKDVVRKFEEHEGPSLQKYLEKKFGCTENWLMEWWDNTSYLECREPLTVYLSPGLVYPLQQFVNESERLEYAAKLILGAIDYKFLIDKNQLPVDYKGKDLLDMNQYQKIFGTCRIPRPRRDELVFNPESRHIVVVKNNNFFKMEVISKDFKVLSFNQILSQLVFIVSKSEIVAAPIGILTSETRNNWCHSREILSRDKLNRQSLNVIEKSLFVLCLDNRLPRRNDDILTQATAQCIHGGGTGGNSGNRWFDKTLQFIVGIDGIVGLTYEHSPSDGQPIANLTDYVVNYIESDKWKTSAHIENEKYPDQLCFKINNELKIAIDKAVISVNKLSNNLELSVFNFTDYGKDFVKSQKLSPDSFIQMAIQYAFYRLHKVPGAHYESAATRKYIHGRTEAIRSCSNESIAFAKEMIDENSTDAKKLESLRKAISAHKKYAIDAINGFGVDRHLLGLKLVAEELGQRLPEFFSDVAFTRSSHMRLLTSQVATKCRGVMAYGPSVPNGYACCYNPRHGDIFFALSCFADSTETDIIEFRKALEASLIEMYSLLVRNQLNKL